VLCLGFCEADSMGTTAWRKVLQAAVHGDASQKLPNGKT
jgi:hypothetical protein